MYIIKKTLIKNELKIVTYEYILIHLTLKIFKQIRKNKHYLKYVIIIIKQNEFTQGGR